MALISKIGSGVFTELSFITKSTNTQPSTEAAHDTAVTTGGFFASPTSVGNLRDFPSFGTPANIVNVPEYGKRTSQQVSAQADAPTFEFTVNYNPSDTGLVALEAAQIAGTELLFLIDVKNDASDNAAFWVSASVASVLVTPSLSDANTAVVTLATSTDYTGPFSS